MRPPSCARPKEASTGVALLALGIHTPRGRQPGRAVRLCRTCVGWLGWAGLSSPSCCLCVCRVAPVAQWLGHDAAAAASRRRAQSVWRISRVPCVCVCVCSQTLHTHTARLYPVAGWLPRLMRFPLPAVWETGGTSAGGPWLGSPQLRKLQVSIGRESPAWGSRLLSKCCMYFFCIATHVVLYCFTMMLSLAFDPLLFARPRFVWQTTAGVACGGCRSKSQCPRPMRRADDMPPSVRVSPSREASILLS